MAKSTTTYFNPLKSDNRGDWEDVDGSHGAVQQLTLAVDPDNGDYTRLTRFIGKVDTSYIGAKRHDYPEEVFIVSGRIYDVTFERWLDAGEYASRPPGEVHGPFITEDDCLVLEMSYPSQAQCMTE